MGQDVNTLLTQGLEHYLNGRLREAASAWEAALRLEPDNRRAREYLRSALSSHGPLRPGREPMERTPPPLPSGPPSTAWDEGPTLVRAISLDAPGPGWTDPTGPHGRLLDEPAAEDEKDQQVGALLRGARELYALNDFSGALELLEKVLALSPGRADAERMREDCVDTLVHMYESQIGPLEATPELAVNPDEIIWLNLDHRAGFVLAQIDGTVTYDDLYAICGLPRLDISRILAQLLGEKVIRTAK